MSTKKVIEITQDNAQAAYNQADAAGKEVLAKLLGRHNVIGNIMELVKTYEDACLVLGKDPQANLAHQNPVTAEQVWENDARRARTIIAALNGDWKADYSNSDQRKWRVWFEYDPSLRRFRFLDTYCGYTIADAGTGARLAFKDEATAKYYGTQFAELETRILLGYDDGPVNGCSAKIS